MRSERIRVIDNHFVDVNKMVDPTSGELDG